jgi:Tfp pilus assembly protein FimT
MSTQTETQTPRERSWLYITSLIVLVVLVVIALFAFRSARETQEAQDKADQLITALQAAGARTPDKEQIVRVLGDDGGATCDNPNKALSRATLLSMLANGATGPGARPVIADSRAVKGQLLIIKIYCPEQLAEFQAFVDDLKTDNVAG